MTTHALSADGWKLDLGEFRTAATRGGHQRIEVDLDGDGFDVDVEAGSGYMREHQTFRLPLSMLRKLLEARGYTLSWKPGFPLPSDRVSGGDT